MYKFGKISKERLKTCDDRLQLVCNEVIKVYDFSILEGIRNKETQDKFYIEGKSKVKYPNSKHNYKPSKAVDIAPYPIDWEDRERFFILAGIMFGIASQLGIRLRWGGAWKGLEGLKNNSFDDLVHFEIID